MDYEITVQPGYLRARLSGRETVEDMRTFMRAVLRECNARGCPSLLIDIHASRPIFHVEPRAFFEEFRKLANGTACKIALLGDTPELRLSNEYLALLARQQGLNIQSFRFEVTALHSLTDRRELRRERRHGSERRDRAAERYAEQQRRQRERRAFRAQPAF